MRRLPSGRRCAGASVEFHPFLTGPCAPTGNTLNLLDALQAKMAEATRLTQAGRLDEATAAIQRALGQGAGAWSEPGPAHAASDPTARRWREAIAARWQEAPLHARTIDVEAREVPTGEPGARSGPGRFERHNHVEPAGRRAYRLYVPASLAGQAPAGLVVMLHGCTQTPEDFAAGTRMNAFAEQQRLVVVYPAQAAKANPNRCWNWFKPEDQARDDGEPAIIAGITRQVATRFGVPPERTFVAGLSAGGAMAQILGRAYPDLFAAVGVHSGLAAGSAKDVASAFGAMKHGAPGSVSRRTVSQGRAPRVIVFHGDADETVASRNARQVVEQSLAALAATPAGAGLVRQRDEGTTDSGRSWAREAWRDAAGISRLEHWTLRGAKHAWAGGDAQGSYTDPRGVDASAEMVRFFLAGA